jgi:hypothetical protein
MGIPILESETSAYVSLIKTSKIKSQEILTFILQNNL